MKTIFSVATILFATFLLSSCAKKMTFGTSRIVPAATGNAKVKKNKNDNYIITVSILNLAEPKNLTPPKNVYVVWMETNGERAKNIGMIKSSSSMFSKALKGEMQATSTTKPDKIYITAEDNGTVEYPGGTRVLSTD